MDSRIFTVVKSLVIQGGRSSSDLQRNRVPSKRCIFYPQAPLANLQDIATE